MDVALLLLIAGCLGAGVGGGVLASWGCHRRLLALEENLKVILTAYDDRISQLTKIVVRQDKTEAAKARWSQKDLKEDALAKTLTQISGTNETPGLGHPWDPRTWGASK
jgi:hypothetical protein